MRIDFYLHFGVTILLLLAFRYILQDWTKAIMATLILQVAKEAHDYVFNKGDFDPIDWLGDSLGYIPLLIYKLAQKIKNEYKTKNWVQYR